MWFNENNKLKKTFQFKTFSEALAFMTSVTVTEKDRKLANIIDILV